MKQSVLTHKGFSGSSETSFEDNCLFGRLLFIDDLIVYEGQTPLDLKAAFIVAVEDYLAHCKTTGKPANKPYSGSFNIRTGAELHKQAAVAAFQRNMSLNEYCVNAIKMCIEHNGVGKVEHTHEHRVTLDVDKTFSATATMEEPSKWEEHHGRRH